MHLSLFIAIADNGVIGRDNGLPWRLSDDLKYLKRMTMGKPIVMGRKTWESFPKRPLPGRPNLVVTRDADYEAPGAEVFTSTDAAIARGSALATELGVDEVHDHPVGDTRFEFDHSRWHEVAREWHDKGEGDTSAYSFVVLER